MDLPAGALACAQAARIYWSGQDLIDAVAIAGAESGWNNAASGDAPAELLAAGLIDEATYLALLPYTCPTGDSHGDTSYGGWQINLSNVAVLPYRNPCSNATWLTASWSHGAQAAHALWLRDGFRPWTTYGGPRYEELLPVAEAAVRAVAQGATPPPTPPQPTHLPPSPPVIGAAGPPPPPPPTSPVWALGGTAALATAGVLLFHAHRYSVRTVLGSRRGGTRHGAPYPRG